MAAGPVRVRHAGGSHGTPFQPAKGGMRAGSGRALPQVTVLNPTPSHPRGRTDLNQAGACRTGRGHPRQGTGAHRAVPQIAEEMSLSRHTIKSQVMSIYRKLGAPPAARPLPGPVSSASWRMTTRSSSHQGDGIRSGMRCHGAVTVGEPSGSDGEVPGDSAQPGDERRRLRPRPSQGPGLVQPSRRL